MDISQRAIGTRSHIYSQVYTAGITATAAAAFYPINGYVMQAAVLYLVRILARIIRIYTSWFQEEPEHFGFKLLRPD